AGSGLGKPPEHTGFTLGAEGRKWVASALFVPLTHSCKPYLTTMLFSRFHEVTMAIDGVTGLRRCARSSARSLVKIQFPLQPYVFSKGHRLPGIHRCYASCDSMMLANRHDPGQ